MFVGILGAALMTVPDYATAFENGDAAGVLKEGMFRLLHRQRLDLISLAVFAPWKGGGDFILVLMALSVVGNNSTSSFLLSFSFFLILVTIVPNTCAYKK